MKYWKLLPIILFFTLIIVFYIGLYRQDQTIIPSPLINKSIPDFNLPNVKNTKQILSKEDLPNKVYLLNIWASWCTSCEAEHSTLLSIKKEGIPIVSLNYKDQIDNANQWLNFKDDPYLCNIFDPSGKLAIDLGVYGTPETFLIDENQIIRYKHVGILDEKVWKTIIRPQYQRLIQVNNL